MKHRTQTTETLHLLNRALLYLDRAKYSNSARDIDSQPLRQATREGITNAQRATATAIEATASALRINVK